MAPRHRRLSWRHVERLIWMLVKLVELIEQLRRIV
jgi:hypothetical protein